MEQAENSLPEIHGKDQMHELVSATFDALKQNGLEDVVQLLMSRVFTREPTQLIDSCDYGPLWQWSFKPMVELLLQHTLSVTTTPGLSSGDRRQEIEGTLELAGF